MRISAYNLSYSRDWSINSSSITNPIKEVISKMDSSRLPYRYFVSICILPVFVICVSAQLKKPTKQSQDRADLVLKTGKSSPVIATRKSTEEYPDWKKISLRSLEFYIPSDMVPNRISFDGNNHNFLHNERQLYLDLSKQAESPTIEKKRLKSYSETFTKIGGVSARIWHYKDTRLMDSPGILHYKSGVYFTFADDQDRGARFEFYSDKPSDNKLAEKIFRSVMFRYAETGPGGLRRGPQVPEIPFSENDYKEWKKIRLNNFDFYAPSNMRDTSRPCYEGGCYRFENPGQTLRVDVSLNAEHPSDRIRLLESYSEIFTKIDGVPAWIWHYEARQTENTEMPIFISGVYFTFENDAAKRMELSFDAGSPQDNSLAEKIFRSIKFHPRPKK